MRKYLYIVFGLLLSACGGGGNPSGEIPPINRAESVAVSNAHITSMVTNSKYQVARYVANKLGDADAQSVNLVRGAFVPAAATGNENYDTAQELIDLAVWLVDNDTSVADIKNKYESSSADENKIKLALKLLNARNLYMGGGHGEQTATNIVNARESLADAAARLRKDTQIFDINSVDFDLAGGRFSDYGQKIKFSTDGRGRIKDISLSGDSRFEEINRNGENATFSVTNRSIYHYTIPIADTDETFFVEGVTSLRELKDKLKTKIAAKFDENSDEYNTYVTQVDSITEDSFANNDEDHGKQILDATFSPEFLGKAVGLRYSDFGLMNITTHFHGRNPENISEAIAGGYTTNEFAENVIQTPMNFTGRAVGSVQYRRYVTENPGTEEANEVLAATESIKLNGDATMNFNPENANQQVNLAFSDWYNVSADTAGNINFVAHENTTTNQNLLFENTAIAGASVNYSRDDNGMNADCAPEIVIRYFGDDVASEAVGYVKVGEERNAGINAHEEILFNAGFGMKTPANN